MSMLPQKNKDITPETQAEIVELQSQTFLNMATCFFLMQKFDKSVQKATESLKLKKSIKGYYRRGKAYGALEQFDNAVNDLKEAVKLDISDPNDIQQELIMYDKKARAQNKERDKKMSGFLLSGKGLSD